MYIVYFTFIKCHAVLSNVLLGDLAGAVRSAPAVVLDQWRDQELCGTHGSLALATMIERTAAVRVCV